MPAFWFRILINLWPPFRGAGIRILSVNKDYSRIEVELAPSRWKRNYIGTHFGGSLYAMTDPFYMLMLLQRLGRDYWVWDLRASIDYLTAEAGPVRALFKLSDEVLADIRAQAANGEKVTPEFHIEIVDRNGTVVARVHRTLYVRLKKNKRPVKTDPAATTSL